MLTLIAKWSQSPEDEEKFIHPKYLIGDKLSSDERRNLVSYLKSGLSIQYKLGYSFCRLPGGPPDDEMGCCEKTDGVWAWPEGLAIYVEQFNVRLPDEFVSHARRNNFNIPPGLDQDQLDQAPYDLQFWYQWCRDEKEQRA